VYGSAHLPDWSAIDTVLLDMDGTLLDLGYDKHFWGEYLPRRFADSRGIPVEEAHRLMRPIFESTAGTLDWYCVNYWSRALSLDIVALKSARIAHVERFGLPDGNIDRDLAHDRIGNGHRGRDAEEEAHPSSIDIETRGPQATSGLAQATLSSRVSRRIFVARALLYTHAAGQPSGFNSFPERTEIQSNKVLQRD